MKTIFTTIASLLAIPLFAQAQTPSIVFFNAGATTINSNQPASLTWRIANGSGWTFSIPCIQGITYKKSDGNNFPCSETISSVLDANGGIDLVIKNLTGAPKTVRVKLTPKDGVGSDFTGGAQEIALTVNPLTNLLENLTSPLSVASGAAYTLNWSGEQVDGVNISISCNSNIRTKSSSYAQGNLPCNTPVFSSDLSRSGNLELIFENIATATSSITLSVLPAMERGVYNGAETKSITVEVSTTQIPDPSTTYFTAKGTDGRVASGAQVPLYWSTVNSDGVTLLFSCNSNITSLVIQGEATSTPACNAPAFTNPFLASSTLLVSFTNSNYAPETISITLAPKSKKGGFDATRGKTITLSILSQNTAGQSVTAFTTATTTTQTQTTNTASSTPKFTRYLYRGVTHAQVSLLQQYLKTRPELYPEGLVTGYFGAATERAVKRLQETYGLGTSITPGYGGVGPKTRALLNSLVK